MSDPFASMYTATEQNYNARAASHSAAHAPSSQHQPPPHPKAPASAHHTRNSSLTRQRSQSHPHVIVEAPKKPQPIVEPPAPILMSGTLEKRIGMAIMPSYHQRYFILAPTALWWYATEDSYNAREKPSKTMPIEKSTYCMSEGETQNKLTIVSHGRQIVVRAGSTDEIQKWKASIQECIHLAQSSTAFTKS